MLGSQTTWGIDIGATSIKLVRIVRRRDELTLLESDSRFLGDDAPKQSADEQRRRLSEALRDLADRHHLRAGARISVAIPGQSAFPQVVSLPPVEPDKVGELVRYEASRRIPYEPDDVVLGHVALPGPTVNEQRLFVLSVRKDIVQWYLEAFRDAQLPVDDLQVAPIALYNYLEYDHKTYVPTIVLDIGRTATDILLVTEEVHWCRTLPIGGFDWTRTLAATAHVSEEEAEQRKVQGSWSEEKTIRALRPDLERLRQEIEKAIDFGLPDLTPSAFRRVWLHGGSAELPGLDAFIQESFPHAKVQRLASLRRLHIVQRAYTSDLHEHLGSLGAALGAAIQGSGQATNDLRLLPHRASRHAASALFLEVACAAAIALLLGLLVLWTRADNRALKQHRSAVESAFEELESTASETKSLRARTDLRRRRLEVLSSAPLNQGGSLLQVREILSTLDGFGSRGLQVLRLEVHSSLRGPDSGLLEIALPVNPSASDTLEQLPNRLSELASIHGLTVTHGPIGASELAWPASPLPVELARFQVVRYRWTVDSDSKA